MNQHCYSVEYESEHKSVGNIAEECYIVLHVPVMKIS